MKITCALVALLFSITLASADTYTGVVSGVKHFASGGVAVDMDGKYPDQKMTLYVSARDKTTVGNLPTEGDKITATGAITQYRGNPEIKIHDAGQWKWQSAESGTITPAQ